MHANPDIDIIALNNSYLATYFERDVRSLARNESVTQSRVGTTIRRQTFGEGSASPPPCITPLGAGTVGAGGAAGTWLDPKRDASACRLAKNVTKRSRG